MEPTMCLQSLACICILIFSNLVDAQVKLEVSPNYLFANTRLDLICDIGEEILDKTVYFYKQSTLLGSVSYIYNNCTSDSSVSYSCDPGRNITKFSYKPVTTQLLDENFYCRFRDDVRWHSASNTVSVKHANIPSTATLSPSLTSYTITKGNTLNTITCLADSCWPLCSFVWKGPNLEKSGANFTISNVAKNDAGTFFCQAKNLVGSASSSNVEVIVQYGPENIQISPTTTIYTKTLGQSLGTITCSADCNPACSYQWVYPDNTVVNSSLLLISSLAKTHDGTFTCRATNSLGNEAVTLSVTVNYSPQNVRTSPEAKSRVINEGNTLTINCFADCKPSCSLRWYDSSGTLITTNGLLRLSNINRNQAKDYRCRAQNDIGTIYSSYVTVTVQTLPSQIENINAECGQTIATVAWNPDLTVVPRENFTLYYRPLSAAITEKKKIFRGLNIHQDILLMHVDDLLPGTIYKFYLISENIRGKRTSPPVSCTTLASTAGESSVNSLMVIGIVMITISVLLVSTWVVIICLIRYRRSLEGSNCPNCFLSCVEKLPSFAPKRRKESDYENIQQGLQQGQQENHQEGNQGGHDNDAYGVEGSPKVSLYEAMLKRESNHSKPYDELCIAGNDSTIETAPQSCSDTSKETHYINLKQERDRKPEVTPKPNKIEKKIPEVALKPNKKGKKVPEVALKPNKKEKKIPEVALKPIKPGANQPDINQKPFKYL